jgi:hypothetical protein
MPCHRIKSQTREPLRDSSLLVWHAVQGAAHQGVSGPKLNVRDVRLWCLNGTMRATRPRTPLKSLHTCTLVRFRRGLRDS